MINWYNWDFDHAYQYFHSTESDYNGYLFHFMIIENEPFIGQVYETDSIDILNRYKWICGFKLKSWKH